MPCTWSSPTQSSKPFGIIQDKNHFINVAVLRNKIVYRGLEENYINLCLVFMECHCSDCFISIERAHCGFIRVEWSPISFSLWPAFPLQCLRITLYKLRGVVWLTRSDSGGLKSPQLCRVLIVPCVNTQCGTPTKEPAMLNCPVPLWGHTGPLFFRVPLLRACYRSYRSLTKGLQKPGRKTLLPMGFPPSGETGTACFSWYMQII